MNARMTDMRLAHHQATASEIDLQATWEQGAEPINGRGGLP